MAFLERVSIEYILRCPLVLLLKVKIFNKDDTDQWLPYILTIKPVSDWDSDTMYLSRWQTSFATSIRISLFINAHLYLVLLTRPFTDISNLIESTSPYVSIHFNLLTSIFFIRPNQGSISLSIILFGSIIIMWQTSTLHHTLCLKLGNPCTIQNNEISSGFTRLLIQLGNYFSGYKIAYICLSIKPSFQAI